MLLLHPGIEIVLTDEALDGEIAIGIIKLQRRINIIDVNALDTVNIIGCGLALVVEVAGKKGAFIEKVRDLGVQLSLISCIRSNTLSVSSSRFFGERIELILVLKYQLVKNELKFIE